jgi:N4-gp56 family major capsid protein
MANTQDQAFIKQFEADAHLAYQQKQSKLRNTVRHKPGVKGSSLRFQKIGKATAATKTRNGDITVSELAHTYVDVTLADYYAGDYIDALDELKMNIDEKGIIKESVAGAIGRKMDDLIITALDGATNVLGTGAAADYSGSTAAANAFAKVKQGVLELNKNDVPDDGQRFCLVTPEVWDLLLDNDKFARAEYVGSDLPFLKGSEARKFMNVIFMVHTGLTVTGAADAQYSKCFMYHKSAIGLGEQEFLKMDVWWDGRKASHFVSGCMAGGAGLVDAEGVVEILINNGLPA